MYRFDEWIFTPQRAAFHVPTATMVVADLHLGYQETRRKKGEAVPLWSTEELLSPLVAVLAVHKVTNLVIAGDLFESSPGENSLREFQTWCSDCRIRLSALIPGNHDLHWIHGEHDLPIVSEGVTLGRWTIVHGHTRLPKCPVMHGHIHPCFRLSDGVSAPCYLLSDSRIVLPAFTEDAAGENVLKRRKWSRYQALVCLPDKVLDFGEVGRMQAKT